MRWCARSGAAPRPPREAGPSRTTASQNAAHFRLIEAEAVQLAGGVQKAVLRRVADQGAGVHQGNGLAQLAVPASKTQLATLEAVQRQLVAQRQLPDRRRVALAQFAHRAGEAAHGDPGGEI